MTDEELEQAVLDALCEVAPDVVAADIDPGADLREEADIDSMDFLNLLIGLERRIGVTVPEADYPRLGSLDQVVAYLRERCSS